MHAMAIEQSETRLVMTRQLDAPVDLVWDAWTDPAHIAQWWGPDGYTTGTDAVELTEGGALSLMLNAPDGSQHPARGRFVEVVPMKKLVIEGDAVAADACGAGLPPKARITIGFEARADGTLLTIDTEFITLDALEAAAAAGYREGWAQSFERLNIYLAERS